MTPTPTATSRFSLVVLRSVFCFRPRLTRPNSLPQDDAPSQPNLPRAEPKIVKKGQGDSSPSSSQVSSHYTFLRTKGGHTLSLSFPSLTFLLLFLSSLPPKRRLRRESSRCGIS